MAGKQRKLRQKADYVADIFVYKIDHKKLL